MLSRMDDYWLSLRPGEIVIPAAHLFRQALSQNSDSVLTTGAEREISLLGRRLETPLERQSSARKSILLAMIPRALPSPNACSGHGA